MTDPLETIRAANPVPEPPTVDATTRREMIEAIVATPAEPSGSTDALLGRRRRIRPGRRPLLLIGIAILVAGSAAAAVVVASLSGERSAPLAGPIPGRPAAGHHGRPPLLLGQAASSYHIASLSPNIEGGSVGWCHQVAFTQPAPPQVVAGDRAELHEPRVPASVKQGIRANLNQKTPLIGFAVLGCEPAPTASWPIVGGNIAPFSGRLSMRQFLSEVQFYYLLTAPRVAAVRLAPNLTILTRTDPGLPFGYRAAVAFPKQQSAHSPARTALSKGSTSAPALLDRYGRPIAITFPPFRRRSFAADPTIFWQVPRSQTPQRAGLQTRHPPGSAPRAAARLTRSVVPATPPAGPCAIGTRQLASARLLFGSVVKEIRAFPQVIGPAYQSCIDTRLMDRGWLFDVAILLDANHPGASPASLPDAVPVAGRRAVLNESVGRPNGDITGRRAGNAWLVVQSTAPLALRLTVLDRLEPCVRTSGRC